MLEYYLQPYGLTEEPEKYRAHVINSRSYTFDDIVDHLIKHNTGFSSAAIYGVWESIKDAVEELISDGGAINTDLFHVSASIKGVFDGIEDSFDGNRHKIQLNLRPGPLLRGIPKEHKVKKVNIGTKSMILSVTDIKTGSVNSYLTPGKNIRIIGQKVKIQGGNPSCGLFFIPAKGSEKPVRIDAADFVVNNPSEIIAIVPNLSRGIWNLRLVTQYCSGSRDLKTPRSVTFEKDFRVA